MYTGAISRPVDLFMWAWYGAARWVSEQLSDDCTTQGGQTKKLIPTSCERRPARVVVTTLWLCRPSHSSDQQRRELLTQLLLWRHNRARPLDLVVFKRRLGEWAQLEWVAKQDSGHYIVLKMFGERHSDPPTGSMLTLVRCLGNQATLCIRALWYPL